MFHSFIILTLKEKVIKFCLLKSFLFQRSTIELSADGPLREPFAVYAQVVCCLFLFPACFILLLPRIRRVGLSGHHVATAGIGGYAYEKQWAIHHDI